MHEKMEFGTNGWPFEVAQLLPCEGRCKSSLFFLLCPSYFVLFKTSPLCGHPSSRTLLLSDFRSVLVECPRFSRYCCLIIDLGSHLFDGSWARHWPQSRELDRCARLFGRNSMLPRSPLRGHFWSPLPCHKESDRRDDGTHADECAPFLRFPYPQIYPRE
jgi:hypothetical protein